MRKFLKRKLVMVAMVMVLITSMSEQIVALYLKSIVITPIQVLSYLFLWPNYNLPIYSNI